MGQGFMRCGHSVGLQGAGLLLVLAVGLGLNSRMVRWLRAEKRIGLIQPAHSIRLIVDAACDVFDVLHMCPAGKNAGLKKM